MAAGFSVQHKLSVKIGVGWDRWAGQELFQSGKDFLAGGTQPHVGHIFLDQVVQGLGDFSEIRNELSVIPRNSLMGLTLVGTGWSFAAQTLSGLGEMPLAEKMCPK